MKPLAIAPLFVPDEALLPLLVIAGVLTIVGLKRFAGGLVLFVLAIAFLPLFQPFIEALIAALPGWAVGTLLVGLGFALLRAFVALIFGRGVSDQMLGTLLADLVRFLILLPFRGFRALLRRFLINGGN